MQSTLGLSQHLDDLLTGKVTPENADPRIMKWAEFAIWQAACEILALTTVDDRRNALGTIPDTIRPYVEREIKRMWNDRRKK
jgi:hypothetical protein